jgi:hypothetical protein
MLGKSFTAVFDFERPTKNTFRFQEKPEGGQPPRIGSLYLQKWLFDKEPRQVKVTVEVVD